MADSIDHRGNSDFAADTTDNTETGGPTLISIEIDRGKDPTESLTGPASDRAAHKSAVPDDFWPDEINPANGRPWRYGDWPMRGWTPSRQRVFLEQIAEGNTVEGACYLVGLSAQSAYAFRNRAAGSAFALGWQAALLQARNVFADRLLNRALEGQTVTITHADGRESVRHFYDNRLGQAMLTRLDRYAEALENTDSHHAARMVAQDFEAYLDLIQRGEGPARAGLYLAARAGESDRGNMLDPVAAFGRAERHLRGGAALAGDIDISDLDPTQRHSWTTEQWLRAEAAGMIALLPNAPVEDADGSSQLPQLNPTEPDDPIACAKRESPVGSRIWRDPATHYWRTDFPPPDDFEGDEYGVYGDSDYHRDLAGDEFDAVDPLLPPDQQAAAEEARWYADCDARDRLFGFIAPPEKEDEEEAADADGGNDADATDTIATQETEMKTTGNTLPNWDPELERRERKMARNLAKAIVAIKKGDTGPAIAALAERAAFKAERAAAEAEAAAAEKS